jgi:hypothetical protein
LPEDYPRTDSEVRAMKKKSAEDVLKNTFEYLDKVVDEKRAENDAEADRGSSGAARSRKIGVVGGDFKTEKAGAFVQGCTRS